MFLFFLAIDLNGCSVLQASALEKWAAQERLDSELELKNPEVRNSVLVHEDMETSDSEESEHERDDPDFDDEWKPEQESERDSEQESVIKQNRKRYFKAGRGSSTSVMLRRSYEENLLCSDEEVRSTTSSDVCCTCTRKSSCKTMKCQCVAAKGSCGPSCGCSSLKCSNRDANGEQNPQVFDEEEQQQDLASRGALLLRTALADKSVEDTNDNEGTKKRRKPLSDIGNTTVKFLLYLILSTYLCDEIV